MELLQNSKYETQFAEQVSIVLAIAGYLPVLTTRELSNKFPCLRQYLLL